MSSSDDDSRVDRRKKKKKEKTKSNKKTTKDSAPPPLDENAPPPPPLDDTPNLKSTGGAIRSTTPPRKNSTSPPPRRNSTSSASNASRTSSDSDSDSDTSELPKKSSKKKRRSSIESESEIEKTPPKKVSKKKKEKRKKSKPSATVSASTSASSTSASSTSSTSASTFSVIEYQKSKRVRIDPNVQTIVNEYSVNDEDPVQENRRTFFTFLFFLTCLCSLDYTLFLPTLYPLLHNDGGSNWYYFTVWVIYHLTQVISSFLYTTISSKKDLKIPLLLSAFCGMLGSIVYSLQSSNENVYLLALARGISGVSGGITITGYCHVARHTFSRFRPRNVSYYRLMEGVGELLGLVIGGVLIEADGLFFLNADKYHFPAFISACCFGIYLIFLSIDLWCKPERIWFVSELFQRTEEEEMANELALEDRDRNHDKILYTNAKKWAILYIYMGVLASYWSAIACQLPGAIPDNDLSDSWDTADNYGIFGACATVFVVAFGFYKSSLPDSDAPTPRTIMMSVLLMMFGLMCMNGFRADTSDDSTTMQKIIFSCILTVGFAAASIQIPIVCVFRDPIIARQLNNFFAFGAIARAIGCGWGVYGYSLGGLNLVTHVAAACLSTCLVIGFSFLTSSDLCLRVLVTVPSQYKATQEKIPEPTQLPRSNISSIEDL